MIHDRSRRSLPSGIAGCCSALVGLALIGGCETHRSTVSLAATSNQSTAAQPLPFRLGAGDALATYARSGHDDPPPGHIATAVE